MYLATGFLPFSHGRSKKPMHLNPGNDLNYVYNYSLWLDIKILLRTAIAVIKSMGAS
jgi:lipopolysaccharide/colanic/teichoic acid biosynthesis glycosyltransferase